MERNENMDNAMLEVQHAIEVGARIKAIRTELDDFITSRLYDTENLSRTDNLTRKLDCAAAAIRANALRSILKSFDFDYTCNSMGDCPLRHMEKLLSMMK